ncbi:hypothetical protein Tco_0561685 [Tanacetum coccineum]
MRIPNVVESTDVDEGIIDDETSKVFKMLKDQQRPLFKGSKRFTSLSFITRLLHIKVLGGWSNKSCMMVLELFFEALEEIGDVVMPKSYYDANKLVYELGFSYETWDACPNDCMLFRGDDKFLDSSCICEASRYKKFNSDKQDDDENAPGDKIDVYLQLLIDELKDLWRDGVSTYDASTKSIAGKMKDHLNTRLDLKELNIRPSLHPQETNSSRILLPPAYITLGKDEKYQFLKLLKYLKIHDNLIILQQLLPLVVRRLLPKHVVEALIELSNFFRILCSKVNSKYDQQKLQDRISLTLCHLENIFPPSFFNIIEHLPIHLAEEALLVGLVQYRWMYLIERYLLTLKIYVHNRARLEGCIAKGALME